MSATRKPSGSLEAVSDTLIDLPSKSAEPPRGIALGASAAVATPTLDPTAALKGAASNEERWKPFEEIGLVPSPATKAAQKFLVSTYRVIGLGILTLFVAVLVGYIAVTTFYFFSRSWIAPIAVTPSNEQVVALQAQLATLLNERARLAGELEQAERAIAAEQSFQLQYVKAIQKDRHGRRIALDRVRQLSEAAAATRAEIRRTNGDYSVSTTERMSEEYDAGIIDRQAMLSGKFHLAQISAANLTLAERQAEFDQRAADLAAQTQSLDALLADRTDKALSYDVLMIARDHETSKLALARETSNRDRLKASIERQDKIIDGLSQSAYLRALADGATVALVPYANLGNAQKGAPLYSCRLEMLICRQVGKVIEVMPGEVEVRHPARDALVRGRMVVMQMSEPDAAQKPVLFAGGPPLGI